MRFTIPLLSLVTAAIAAAIPPITDLHSRVEGTTDLGDAHAGAAFPCAGVQDLADVDGIANSLPSTSSLGPVDTSEDPALVEPQAAPLFKYAREDSVPLEGGVGNDASVVEEIRKAVTNFVNRRMDATGLGIRHDVGITPAVGEEDASAISPEDSVDDFADLFERDEFEDC